MLEELRFLDVRIGPSVDTFRGASGERKARQFDVYGYPFFARKPA
jgi:arsenite methyltransferase